MPADPARHHAAPGEVGDAVEQAEVASRLDDLRAAGLAHRPPDERHDERSRVDGPHRARHDRDAASVDDERWRDGEQVDRVDRLGRRHAQPVGGVGRRSIGRGYRWRRGRGRRRRTAGGRDDERDGGEAGDGSHDVPLLEGRTYRTGETARRFLSPRRFRHPVTGRIFVRDAAVPRPRAEHDHSDMMPRMQPDTRPRTAWRRREDEHPCSDSMPVSRGPAGADENGRAGADWTRCPPRTYVVCRVRRGVDATATTRVDSAAAEQVARPALSEALRKMAHVTLSYTRTIAPLSGAVGGRGVPTSR